MLRQVNFDPAHPTTIAATERLADFHATAAKVASRHFRVLQLNDGMAFYRELSPRSRSVTADFLMRSIDVYETINEVDKGNSFPGARMVIAVGPRMRVGDTDITGSSHLESILARVRSRSLSITQALFEAFQSRPVAYAVPMLEANFAFTKAYLADQCGTDCGLEGSNCYVDLDLFARVDIPWISFSRKVPWETDGMGTVFGKYSGIDRALAGQQQYEGILNALELAEGLGVVLSV